MTDPELLSAVIGEIYDAALEPSLWPSVLELVCGFVGGFAASMFVHDHTSKHANIVCKWGVDPVAWQAYDETYMRINPVFPILMLKDTGTVLANVDLVPDHRLQATRFYKEWLKPLGFVDTIGTVLEKSWTSCAVFAVMRNAEQGLVDEATRRRMALLIPHLQRAVMIGKTIELKNVANANFARTFDALSTAIYLLSEDRDILHANRSGLDLRADDVVLTASGNRFQARDPAHDFQFRAIFTAACSGDMTIMGKASAIAIAARDGERYIAHVLPLGLGVRGRIRPYHGAAFAVFIHQAALQRPTLVESVAERFRLTPSELRVLFAIIELGGVPEVGPVLGVTAATVRTHLKHVFQKTGTKRQADLVKLVTEFANPPLV